ncbi:helix-hairpin-helix domain-containing protein [Streptomyces sp. NPDC050658]|uniref:helix-hairpin-helix domain-containing protein n=1 Tax=unclassified Streptomyces TaxID=2593676 RepID=UPI00342CE27F
MTSLASSSTPDKASPPTAESTAGASGSDLPAGIGKPATRALHGAGITTLDQVARRTRRELLALHGVGPKAVRLLAEALERQGKSLA